MPKVVPEYLELRRQQIVDAAAACFTRRGFHLTTMQDICDEAGMSPGALYRYFRSKEEIIEAMCARGQSQNGEAIAEAMAQPDTESILNALIEIFFSNFGPGGRTEETCALNVELIAEAPRNERIRESLVRNNYEARNRFTELMRIAQANGEVDPTLDPESIARAMIACYHGYITQKLVEPNLDIAGYADVLRALFTGHFWQAASTSTPAPSKRSAVVDTAAAVLRH